MKSRFPICFWAAVFGAVTYVSFTILAYVHYPLPFSPGENWLSDLGDQMVNPEGAIFYNTGVILSAICLATWFTAGLSQWRLNRPIAHKRLLLISQIAGLIAAFALIMSALNPINYVQVHSFWSKIHFMMFGTGFGFSVAALRYHPGFTKANIFIGVCTAVMPTFMFVFEKVFWLEWVAVGCILVYMLSTGISSLDLRIQESPQTVNAS